ncbi:hypothetical protein KDW_43390 [Dictyobacter vulcani]|uniref:Carrier domain-containing protein n=1 Tax=Dictyobacter vulcani TaxID=2607529 RepID=A0A5J4KUM8_9CHLR|nr:non-ribosomal peptide synthetase [Dictyobacter vulcani]GER90177.1 hypothetical protein KDW_43390 [Dictyobacter vulcani]
MECDLDPLSRQATIHELFAEQVTRDPQATALVFDAQSLSYAELNRRANQVAHYLRSLGVGPDTLVALCIERSLEMVVSLLGILKAGGAYVPLDPTYPKDRLAFMLQDADVAVLLTLRPFVQELPAYSGQLLCLDELTETLATQSEQNPDNLTAAGNLAYVMYTSGSTGIPKGTSVPHRAVVRLVKETNFAEFSDQDIFLQFAPISFDASTLELWGSLLNGAQLVIFPPYIPSLEELGQVLQQHQVSILWLTAGLFHQMVEHQLTALQSVRQLLAGGDVLAVQQVRKLLEQGWQTCLINGYGPTENTTFTCCYRMHTVEQVQGTVPIGVPINNSSVYILDAYLQPVPIGVAGTLYTGGAGLARGYLKRPELTAEYFIPHPFSDQPGERLYNTGDLVRYLPDGNIEFIGRRDQQVKVRGFRIELSEIENVLLQHPAIQDATVVLNEEQSSKRLVAYLVASADEQVAASALRQFLQERLPDYMLPAAFVYLAALPLTPNGKVDRRALPSPDYTQSEQEYIAPRTPTERILSDIWCQVLGLEKVSVHDNFFALGGDSILSLQIIARANQAGLRLAPRQLFQYPTVAGLAAIVEISDTGTGLDVEQRTILGDVVLTPVQRWFFDQKIMSPHHWNQALLLSTTQALKPEILQAAVDALCVHHDALRLRFVYEKAGWRQYNADSEESTTITVVHLAHMPVAERTAAIEELAQEAQASLDLTAGPLLRVLYFDQGEDEEGRLLLILHHLIVDGVSWRILLTDLNTLYEQLSQGRDIQLPLKTTSFQEWAQRLAAYAQTAELQAEVPFWLAQLEQNNAKMPLDYAGGENSVISSHTHTVTLDAEATTALLHDVPSAYRTQINDVLLAALAQVLTAWCGTDSILLDLEGHGREDILAGVDLSRTVGWFTSIYPVALSVNGQWGAEHLLKSIKEQLRQVPQRGIGYGLLRYLCEDETVAEQMRSVPTPEISFNYLGQFDSAARESGLFGPASEASGNPHHPLGARAHLLGINGSIAGGQLQMSWSYSENFHASETVIALANNYIKVLSELINHCRRADSGGYTPSDFALAHLTQSQIDHMLGSDRRVENIYPLVPMQQGLLFQSIYAGGQGDYIVQIGYSFKGQLDIAALLQSWQHVVNQHPILRTAFLWDGLDEPVQMVRQQISLPVTQLDWHNLSSAEQQERLKTLLQEDRLQGFDPSQAPLMRFTVIQLAEDRYEFFWTHHHILLDGWSLPLILKQVFDSYRALSQKRTPQLERVRAYEDYISWWLRQDMQQAEAFWRQLLHGFSTPTLLGSALVKKEQAEQSQQAEQQVALSEEMTHTLQQVARQHELTLNTLVQGAWAILLSRYTGQDDIVFGTTVSGRPAEIIGIEAMIGLFINTLPVRIQVSPEKTLFSWLQSLQELQSKMRQYEYSSLAKIQNWSELAGGTALFDTLFVFENYPLSASEQSSEQQELSIEAVQSKEQTEYPLTLYALPGQALTFDAHYDPAIFDAASINRLLKHFVTLLTGIANNIEQTIVSLPMLSALELQQSMESGPVSQNSALCIHDLFAAQAQRTPLATALIVGTERVSYEQLNRRANQVAQYLCKQGVGPDVLVGVCMERSVDMIVGILGILKAGGAYVPLDPNYPQERLTFSLQDTQAPILLTQAALTQRLPAYGGHIICLDTDWPTIEQERIEAPTTTVSAEHLAYVIYTSGSTGVPKGVAIAHRSTLGLLYWARDQYTATDLAGVLAATSICFDLSIYEIFVPLSWGGTVIVADNALQLPQLAAAQEVTLINTVPSAMNELVRVGQVPSSVRVVNLAGEPLPRRLVQQLYALEHIQHVYNLYGPTEDTTYSTGIRLASAEGAIVPIGYPLPNKQAYVLDQHLRLVPLGVAGELYLAGPGLARGYLQRGDLVAERFIAHPFSTEPGARLYKTGDLVRYQEDGVLEYIGRIDHQVKVRGFRIELGEVEHKLLSHPALQETVVVVREDTPGIKQLVAYIVAAHKDLTAAELRSYLQEHLPEHMIPVVFVFMAALPLTPNGKVDRKALPAPNTVLAERKDVASGPRTETERLLTAIWEQVLGVQPIGLHDNFFTLGGDSILSLQIVSRARQAGMQLSPRHIFQHPTLAEQASVVAIDTTSTVIDAEQEMVSGQVPLTPIQHWFFEQEIAENHHWNQAVLLSVAENLSPSVLENTVAQLLQHHDALRMRFTLEETGWHQDNAAWDSSVPFAFIDLAANTEDEQRAAIEKQAREVQASLKLATGPLLRVVYFDLGAGKAGRLLIVIHHLVVDGVSWRILLADLQASYQQLFAGQVASLSAKTTSFQHWSYLLQEYAQSEEPRAEIAYWQSLADKPQAQMPVDDLAGENTVASARLVTLALSAEETQALLHVVPQAYRTQINDLLLAAVLLGYASWSGQNTLLINLEGHGREDLFADVDLSRSVGWFTTLFPLFLQLEQPSRLDEMLKAVKEQLRQVPQHGIGYGLLRYLHLDPEVVESMRALPTAQISFNYLGQFDQDSNESTFFAPASEASGAVISAQAKRAHLLDINGSVSGGQLQMTWTYSQNVHKVESMQALAENVMQALRDLIAHCQLPEVGGYTPSDFPLAPLSQEQLDTLLGTDRLVESLYPLSPLQKGLLFHTLYAPDSGDYIVQSEFTFKGHCDVAALEQAWQLVVNHHPILRTAFLMDNVAEPLQVVRRQVRVPFVELDWCDVAPGEQEERLSAYLQTDRSTGFVLSQAPLLRLALIRFSDDSYKFIWSYHHILLDGWSLPIVLKDVFESYEALCQKNAPRLASIRPYEEYIKWWLQQDMQQAETCWRKTLQGFSTPTQLGIDRVAVSEQPRMYRERAREVGAETVHLLNTLARQHQLTLNTLIQGAWALVLSQYSGQDDIVFGATVSGRPADVQNIETMVGLFINTLPVRMQIAPDVSLLNWMQAIQEQQSELRQYEYTPLAQVQAWSDIPQGTALFDSLLVFENYPIDASTRSTESSLQLAGLKSHEQTNYPLTLLAQPGQTLSLRILFDQSRFEASAIEHLLQHLHTLLEQMVTKVNMPLARMSMLHEAEQHELIVNWNDTQRDYPAESSIQQLFEAQVKQQPARTALVFEQQRLSYAELNSRANQVAHYLKKLGVGPETLVGLCMERCVEMIVGMLGILKAGGAYIPLDPNYPQERLLFSLEDTQAPVVLTQAHLIEPMQEHPATFVCLDTDWSQIAQESPHNLPVSACADNLAYVIYTSGSTGKPKGVGIAHRSALTLLHWAHEHFDQQALAGVLASTSICFDLSVFEIFVPLSWGAA